MEYYSAMKKNEIGSFVETWMDLESNMQSEVSQRNKDHTLTHMCGIQKNSIDEPICKADTETQMQRTSVWTPKRGMGCRRLGRRAHTIGPTRKGDN